VRQATSRIAAACAALSLLFVASAVWVASGAAATTSTAVSSNWAGYAVTGSTYEQVTGTWVQPAASCTTATSTTAAAFWVGLGGDTSTSSSLEQTGTEADCDAEGGVRYSAWYELLPAASVKIPLRVAAGNTISATVRVHGRKVTVQVRNLTSGASYTKTLTAESPDLSSAEWIAEAPAVETGGGTAVMPLTDFGTVTFTKATATTASGLTRSIAGAGTSIERIRLVSSSFGPGRFGPDQAAVEAVPSSLTSAGNGFSVAWKETAGASVPAGPPGPGGFGF